ncbi:MAG: response regulator [Planctomycetes bacterium]|nr:response regulator [Planctomycetota bacterium]
MTNHTVLCVDDEASVLAALKRLLRKEDYAVLTAESGAEGLALLEKNPVQVVISDQRMPQMTGTEFLQQVKGRRPEAVRVILSGYAEMASILEAINQGEIYRFLAKPWQDEELKVAIRQCLEQYDIRAENRQLLRQIQAQNGQLKVLNGKLEETVQERTRSLQMSQDILSKLGTPILGVSVEGLVVFVNEAASALLPSDTRNLVGVAASDVFPDGIMKAIDRCLGGSESVQAHPVQWADRSLRVRVDPLKTEGRLRGCILTLGGGYERASDG